jgi:hypothetical protein
MSTSKINKFIGWVVKVASVIVCAPVTWKVAAAALTDDTMHPALSALVSASAVLLVEGVLLSNWLLLETNKQADAAVKGRYALTALVMYFGLWAIALQHNEGMTGIVIRLALGLALVGSGWDTYVATYRAIVRNEEKSIENSWAVKRHLRKAARTDARQRIDAEYVRLKLERDADLSVDTARIRYERDGRLSAFNPLPGQPDELPSMPVPRPSQPRPVPISRHPASINGIPLWTATTDEQRQIVLDYFVDNPTHKTRDAELVLPIGKSAINDVLRSLEADGLIHRNGQVSVL